MLKDKAYRAAYLIAGYIRGTLLEAEKDELDEWLVEDEANIRLFAELTDEKNLEAALKERDSYNSELAIEKLRAKIGKPKSRRRVWQYAAAVFVVVFAIFLYQISQSPRVDDAITKADFEPAAHKAVLTLGDGQQLPLGNQEKAIVLKNGWEINENKLIATELTEASEYYTLSTPKGGQYKLQLPDSSTVWLNAESSIRFPARFQNSVREVFVEGEVYFDVFKDVNKTFVVNAGSAKTEVLGTRFNVNTYEGENAVVITLASGSVKVTEGSGQSVLLEPGYQVKTLPGKIGEKGKVIVEDVVSWKNGWFHFKDSDINSIMNEVARWYNVEVKYTDSVRFHFNADIEREVPVSKLLELLEMTGRVKFTIQDRTIIVSP